MNISHYAKWSTQLVTIFLAAAVIGCIGPGADPYPSDESDEEIDSFAEAASAVARDVPQEQDLGPQCGSWVNTGISNVTARACIYGGNTAYKQALVQVYNNNATERFIYNIYSGVDDTWGINKCSPAWMPAYQTYNCWSANVNDPAGSNSATGSVEWASWSYTYVSSPAVP